jgi:hypothetical protein
VRRWPNRQRRDGDARPRRSRRSALRYGCFYRYESISGGTQAAVWRGVPHSQAHPVIALRLTPKPLELIQAPEFEALPQTIGQPGWWQPPVPYPGAQPSGTLDGGHNQIRGAGLSPSP